MTIVVRVVSSKAQAMMTALTSQTGALSKVSKSASASTTTLATAQKKAAVANAEAAKTAKAAATANAALDKAVKAAALAQSGSAKATKSAAVANSELAATSKNAAAANTMAAKAAKTAAAANVTLAKSEQAAAVAAAKASIANEGFSRSLQTSRLMKFGNQLQWTGRQLQYNFTLPIALAGLAAMKFAMDNEKAFTRVKKVYGDTQAAAEQFRKENKNLTQEMAEQKATRIFTAELNALQDAFVAISNHYGVQQKEVLETAAAWAAAGASGRALAESVNLTMKAMILGELDSASATKALIAIQAQYNLNTKELGATLAQLNAIENSTAVTTGDLIEGFQRVAGVAREAGIDTRHLGALLAALVPAAGSAANAGNALKTIISRLLAPTGEAADLMEEIGLNIKGAAWQSSNGTERLLMMSEAFHKLDDSEKAVISSTVASRWQINKFSILMDELLPKQSAYETALEATASQTKAYEIAQRELNAVLQSNPQKLQQAWVILQNAMAEVIVPIIPHIVYLVQQVARLVTAFANLSPETQKIVLFLVLFLAAVGPVVRYMGSLATLTRVVAQGFVIAWVALGKFVGALIALKGIFPLIARGAMALGSALLGPWGIALAAAIGLLVYFRDDVAKIFQQLVGYIVDAFYMLPQAVQNAMIAVARIVQQVALEIYEWLQYINPFAHHSPSVVENVEGGVGAINNAFGKLDRSSQHIKNTVNDINTLKGSLYDLIKAADRLQQRQDRATIAKVAPGAVAGYDRLIGKLHELERTLARLQGAINRQEGVVARWQARVDAATRAIERQEAKLDRLNAALERQQDKLEKAQDALSHWQEKLDAAQSSLDYFANAPLKGMDAMEDKIFANEMAQKKLRLEMMKLEDVVGPLDDIQQKMNEINGAQELLRGEKANLRNAGAGSEILSQYDKEIGKLEDQKDHFEEAAEKLEDMQIKLEALQRQAEKLDLIKAMKFDELQHRIDELVNQQKELTFEQIVNGIRKAKNQISFYSDKVDHATQAVNNQQNAVDKASNAVERQQDVIDRMNKHRDRLQKRLDRESDQLTNIQEKYDAVNSSIQDISSTLSEATSAAEQFTQALAGKKGTDAGTKLSDKLSSKPELSPALEAFANANNGNFPDVSGTGIPSRKDWSSQVKGINAFTEDLANQTANMFGDINPFAGIGKQAGGAFGKVSAGIKAGAKATADWLTNFWNNNKAFQGVKAQAVRIWGFIAQVIRDVARVAVNAWKLFGPEIIKTFEAIGFALVQVWEKVAPEVAKFRETLRPLGQMINNIWTDLKPFIAIILAVFALVAKVVWSTVNGALKPAIEAMANIFAGMLQQLRGVIKIIAGAFNLVHEVVMGVVSVFTGDWQDAADHFGRAGQAIMDILSGIKDVFQGTWRVISGMIGGFIKTILGAIGGFVMGIVDFFKWLYDVLVGHSIIPDMIHAIVDWFMWLPKQIIKFIGDLPGRIVDIFVAVAKAVASWGKKWLGKLKDFFTDLPGKIYDFLKDLPGEVWDAYWRIVIAIGKWEVKWLKKLKDFFTSIPGKVYDFLKKLKDRAWDAFMDLLERIGKWEIKWLKKIKDFFTSIPGKVYDFLKKLPDRAWDAFMNVLQKVGQWEIKWGKRLKDFFSSIPGKVRDWLSDLPSKLRDVFDKAAKAAGDAFEKIKNAVKKPINWVIKNVINQGIIKAFNWLSGKVSGPHIDPFPLFREGGWTGPGHADQVAGVVHADEQVIRKDSRRKLERSRPHALDYMNRTGLWPGMGYAEGGRVWPVGTHYWTSYPGHDGMDFPAPLGTPIHAAAAGRTSYVGWGRGYGLAAFEKGPYGELVYGHMLRAATHKGERLRAGEVIGYVDSTGNSSGNHLHFGFPGSQGGTPEKARRFLEGANIVGSGSTGGGGVVDFLSSLPGKVVDALKSPLEYLKGKLPDLSRLDGYQLGKILKATTKTLTSAAADKLKGLASSILFHGSQPAYDRNGAISLARQMVPYEWSQNPDQWNALIQLWDHESGWNYQADNPSSSAYGIPQALIDLHGIKPPYYDRKTGTGASTHAYGGDTATQLRWGINYIQDRYGNPLNAWNYWLSHHSYQEGGHVTDLARGGIAMRQPGGTIARIAEGRHDEAVVPLPAGWRSRGLGTENNFYGDLSFPNITDPNDAEQFIRNLESLAGGAA